MDREKRFCELDDQVESMAEDEQKFMLWQLLKKYANGIKVPEECNTIEEYREKQMNNRLWVCCEDLIDYIGFELWN